MAQCDGQIVTSVQTDREMRDRIENRAREEGISKSECLRRVLDLWRQIEEGAECPECGTELEVQL